MSWQWEEIEIQRACRAEAEAETSRLREQVFKLEQALKLCYKALEAQEARNHYPPPFGHDCMWCSDCVQKVKDLRRAALGL